MIHLITNPLNIRYLSGFTGSVSILLLHKNKSLLFVDGRYTDQAKSEVYKGIKVITAHLSSSLIDAVSNYLKSEKNLVIGLEEDKISVSDMKKLRGKFGDFKVQDISGSLREKRCIKSKGEIELIRKAALIADLVFDCILRIIRPAMSEKEISAHIDYLTKTLKGDFTAFETLVASGINAVNPHCKPTDHILKRGELVLMDFGVRYKGYNSDMTRMVSLGSPSKKHLSIYDTLLRAQETAISKVKAGIPASDVDRAARQILKKAKLDKYFTHSTGHGVGLAVHEGPRVSAESKDILREGMVITVEPGVYIKGFGGFRIEDMVLVKKNGYELLTRSSKTLQVLL